MSLLRQASVHILVSGPRESASVADRNALNSLARALRLVEWIAELMRSAGKRAPDGCLSLLQKVLRKVASWMRQIMPVAAPEQPARAVTLHAARGWVRSYHVLTSLRGCLTRDVVSFPLLVLSHTRQASPSLARCTSAGSRRTRRGRSRRCASRTLATRAPSCTSATRSGRSGAARA